MDNFGIGLKNKLNELSLPKDHPQLEGIRQYYPLKIEGCTDKELNEVKSFQKVTHLPSLYIDVMKHIGKRSGDFFLGYDFVYYYLTRYNFRDAANKILKLRGFSLLDDSYYVFMNRQSAY